MENSGEIPIYAEFCTNINFMRDRRAFIAKTKCLVLN